MAKETIGPIMNQIVANTTAPRTCSCGKKFLPPAIAPNAKLCRVCHKGAQEKDSQRRAAIRAVDERKAEQALAVVALKEAFLKNELPKSATVRRNGRQIVVCWMGRSTTFYTN